MHTSIKTLVLFSLAISSTALAKERYELSITNGSGMPLSPGALYVSQTQDSVTEVGQSASKGFVQLCTTGNPAGILTELGANRDVASSAPTPGQVQPGQTIKVEFEARRPFDESVHFVAMYGKSKDTCTVVDIDNAHLGAVASGNAVRGVDQALSTGAFGDPATPADPATACTGAASGIDCVRALAQPASGTIRFFPGYFGGLESFLEGRFGADDLRTLILNSGSVSYKLRRIR